MNGPVQDIPTGQLMQEFREVLLALGRDPLHAGPVEAGGRVGGGSAQEDGMVTEEPFGFIPVCLRCGAEGDKIPVAETHVGAG